MEKTNNTGILRIAIAGPESTGKSTLAEQLAKHYNTVFVPEYAREYIDNLNRAYTLDDIVIISKKQIELEDELLPEARRLLICDTNLIVTQIWAEHKYGKCPEWIKDTIKERHYDLHLLCNIDIPWKSDPQREHPQLREYLFEKYRQELEAMHVPVVLISGLGKTRTENAITAIENIIKKKENLRN